MEINHCCYMHYYEAFNLNLRHRIGGGFLCTDQSCPLSHNTRESGKKILATYAK